MQYLLLIYANESEPTPDLAPEYGAFTRGIVQGGAFKGAERLAPTSSAVTVRVRDGETMITDGPFTETREQLGGYYVVEAKDLDEAKAIAARIPSARYGCVEVRPIFQMG